MSKRILDQELKVKKIKLYQKRVKKDREIYEAALIT